MSRKPYPFRGRKGKRREAEVTHYARAVAATPVGVVGYGNWGRTIVRDLVELGAAVTVVARTETKSREALDAGVVRVVSHTDDLPDDLEGLVVATPTATSRGGDQGGHLPRGPDLRREAAHDRHRNGRAARRARAGPSVRHAQVALPPGVELLGGDRTFRGARPRRRASHRARRLGQSPPRRGRRLDPRPARSLDFPRDPRRDPGASKLRLRKSSAGNGRASWASWARRRGSRSSPRLLTRSRGVRSRRHLP